MKQISKYAIGQGLILIFFGLLYEYAVLPIYNSTKQPKIADSNKNQDNQTQQSALASSNSNANNYKANEFGEGNGKLNLYKTCNNCGEIKVWIDNIWAGTLISSFSSTNNPFCGEAGTLSKILSTGDHSIYGEDSYRHTAVSKVYVSEGKCTLKEFLFADDLPPKPTSENSSSIKVSSDATDFCYKGINANRGYDQLAGKIAFQYSEWSFNITARALYNEIKKNLLQYNLCDENGKRIEWDYSEIKDAINSGHSRFPIGNWRNSRWYPDKADFYDTETLKLNGNANVYCYTWEYYLDENKEVIHNSKDYALFILGGQDTYGKACLNPGYMIMDLDSKGNMWK